MALKSTPTRSTIVEYWYNLAAKAYDDSTIERLPRFTMRLLADVGEPTCWGCQTYSKDWDYWQWDQAKEKHTIKDLFRNWNRLPLERCHVIPRSRGGSYEPENLVLLCLKCHKDAPDVTDPSVMFRWLDARPKEIREKCWNELVHISGVLGVDTIRLAKKYINVMSFCEKEFLKFSVKHSATHGFDHYSFSSELACANAFPDEVVEKAIAKAGCDAF